MSRVQVSALLQQWVAMVSGRPWRTLLLMSLATIAIGYHAHQSFSIDPNTTDLIRQEAQWREDYEVFKAEFPHLIHASFVVISGSNRNRVDDITRELTQSLMNDGRFESVFAPSAMDFFRDHSLLYLGPDELDLFLSELAQMQPFLSRLAEDPTLRGLFELLEEGLQRAQQEPLPEGFGKLVSLTAATANSLLEGKPQPPDWRGHLQPETSEHHYRFIIVKTGAESAESLGNREVVDALAGHIDPLRLLNPGTEIRLTGHIPLDYEQMRDATEGAKLAGLASLALLALILTLGVRSVIVVVAIYLAIFVGLAWTTSFAGITVGSFNPISLIFLVMFIGLGVDFGIHYCLRYQEHLSAGSTQLAALQQAANRAGQPIALCAVSSALGFLAFTPTDYLGLGELGIISAGGMAIALFLSFTLIPAILAVGPTPGPLKRSGQGYTATLEMLSRHRLPFILSVIVITLGAAWLSLNMSFNFSTLALHNPDSKAMSTLRELHEEDIMTSFAISVIAPDAETAEHYAQRLASLSTVSEVRLPRDHLPGDQEENLAILEDAAFFLHPLMDAEYQPGNTTPAQRARANTSLIDTGRHLLDDPTATVSTEHRQAMQELFEKLATIQKSPRRNELLAQLESLLIGDMENELASLQRMLRVDAIDFEDLPRVLHERLVSDNGKHLVTVLPSGDITNPSALREFVQQVRGEVANATGRPVVEYGVGEVVVQAFIEALTYAVVAIALVLLIALRSLVDTLLVFIPLLLALIFTLAVAVLINEPLNMANIIVLPLIFGLGVDNGIHIIRRFREKPDMDSLLSSSTPRAVTLSALSTLGTFGALTLSPHQGMHTIGLLLTLAISFQLLFTLLFLPVLLELFQRSPGHVPGKGH